LAVRGSADRGAGMPDTPTAAGRGCPSLAEVAPPIRVIVGPPTREPGLRDYLSGLFRDVVTDPKVDEQMQAAGITLEYIEPDVVGQTINTAFDKLDELPALQQLLNR